MNGFNVGFCFLDDDDYDEDNGDADRDSRILRDWHSQLWSKELPSGESLNWLPEPGGMYLAHRGRTGEFRVSSDTIATTHSRYVPDLYAELGPTTQEAYERAFYTIGGFVIFPVHSQSLNQQRGWNRAIADRFDLTLECIRRHYAGESQNPLANVLQVDARFFDLFGEGVQGFANYVNFFLLQDLVSGDTIKWLDEFDDAEWSFDAPPLPQSIDAYRTYLDNVSAFVHSRSLRMQEWYDARGRD